MSTTPQKGSETPAWSRHGDDSAKTPGAGRESGPAFRGISRGRGRGGSTGRGRSGARGAGWRSVSAKGTSEVKASPPPPLPEKPAVGGAPAVKNSTQPAKGRDALKIPSRPNLAVDGSPARPSDAQSPISPNKPPRRRRNTHRRAASAAMPKPLSATLTDGLPTSPSTPLMPSKDSKDLPPHLGNVTPVHDLSQDIRHLVEHTRDMAMNNTRPKSPSVRIDWAGDDDDSLPDLDDWGVSSKLASEAGESSSAVEIKPVAITEIPKKPAPPPEKAESTHRVNAQPVDVEGSAERPEESSVSLSVPLAPPVKRERERRRERGSRRDKEKRASLGLQVNGTKGTQASLAATPKKSLLERLSSPVRPDPPAALEGSNLPNSNSDQRIVTSVSEPALPHHPSLPPKPVSTPKKLVPSGKNAGTWRDKRPEANTPKEKTPPAPSMSITNGKAVDDSPSEPSGQVHIIAPPPERTETINEFGKPDESSTFDWSEEPLSVEPPADPQTEPPINITIEPVAPTEVTPPQEPSTIDSPLLAWETSTPTKPSENALANPRLRMQRPLSGDATPRQRRDRSPYKTHNVRNHSAPHNGLGGVGGRSRPQHSSRPIIRMDALQMISRSLREDPPSRRESPPTTKSAE
ncbi:uncharacterized protein FOMMEDRAFT_147808 [Fomitiporia mediterranea MF3/22]|uniref:uncharacterized protein n=1 Tax=Fomitiporia mediterranea (strain MF3/22) TaxID=694068 RepID=UPI0004409216|nr:uncharacterized protein FOMMEDRAFT_147808 [Fomitiporia mediterranea MF3/22]EJD01212.1 hypothetical protein FOMMEDRAFT_147808 [Fomitiporia mediterranea MF3/22]